MEHSETICQFRDHNKCEQRNIPKNTDEGRIFIEDIGIPCDQTRRVTGIDCINQRVLNQTRVRFKLILLNFRRIKMQQRWLLGTAFGRVLFPAAPQYMCRSTCCAAVHVVFGNLKPRYQQNCLVLGLDKKIILKTASNWMKILETPLTTDKRTVCLGARELKTSGTGDVLSELRVKSSVGDNYPVWLR